MIQVRNNSVLTTPVAITASGGIVPFDTVVINSNSNTSLSNNSILVTIPGVYNATCSAVVSNAGEEAVTVTLTAYADSIAISGATVTETIAASSTATLQIPWTSKIISASSGTAALSWTISGGAVNLVNASAIVFKHT